MKTGKRYGSAKLPLRARCRRAASAYARPKAAPDRWRALEPSARSANVAEASAERSEGTMEARRVEILGSIHDSATGTAGDATKNCPGFACDASKLDSSRLVSSRLVSSTGTGDRFVADDVGTRQFGSTAGCDQASDWVFTQLALDAAQRTSNTPAELRSMNRPLPTYCKSRAS